MANELSIVASLNYVNSATPLYQATQQFTVQLDAVGKKYKGGSQSIANSEENLDKGDIGNVGWVILKNLHASITITMGTTTGQLPITIPAGGITMVYLNATNAIVLADAAGPAEVEYLMIEA